MKIAVTYENGEIFQHFGHTAEFKIYEVADGKVTCSCEVLEGFGVIVPYVYLFVDSSKAQAVSNDKGVNPIILWKVVIRFFELIDLLRIEDMNLSVKGCKRGIFPEKIYKVVTIDGCCFKTYGNCIKGFRS